MSSSGPGAGPAGRPVRGNAARIIVPIVAVPLGVAFAWNYFSRGNPIKTPGVSNIEKAYTAGGAKGTHTPAYGGTPRGNQKDDTLDGNPNPSGGADKFKKVNSDGEPSQGMEHRPVQPTRVGKMYNEAMYGNVDGKDNKGHDGK